MFTHLVFPSIRRKMKRGSALCLLGLLAFIIARSPAWGQGSTASSTTPPANGKKMKASLPHLYWHFLNYQMHLDQVAAQRAQEGKDASVWRDHFQKRLNFSDADYAKVRASAQRLQSELKSLDAQAMAIINADRAANPRPPGTPQPLPIPPELKALQRHHEATIQAEVTNLKSALGPELSARMDKFLQDQVIRYAATKKVGTPPTPAQVKQHIQQALQNQQEAQQ